MKGGTSDDRLMVWLWEYMTNGLEVNLLGRDRVKVEAVICRDVG